MTANRSFTIEIVVVNLFSRQFICSTTNLTQIFVWFKILHSFDMLEWQTFFDIHTRKTTNWKHFPVQQIKKVNRNWSIFTHFQYLFLGISNDLMETLTYCETHFNEQKRQRNRLTATQNETKCNISVHFAQNLKMRNINQSYRIWTQFWKTYVGIKLKFSIDRNFSEQRQRVVELMMRKDGSVVFLLLFFLFVVLSIFAQNNKTADDYDRRHCVWVLFVLKFIF